MVCGHSIYLHLTPNMHRNPPKLTQEFYVQFSFK